MSELEIVKRLKKLMERAEQLNRIELVVGIPNDKNSRDESSGITNSELGVIHEFGVPEKNIPERSFMRSTASEEAENVGRLSNVQIAEYLKSENSTHDVFATVGTYLQGKIIDKITDGNFEPNKEETIKRKKSSKALIDTGQLRGSITYEIREK